MLEEIKKEFTPFKFLVVLLIIAVSIYLFQILVQFLGNFSDIIFILIIAWLLSFILEPPVNFLGKILKLPKVWSALIIYLILGLFITILIFTFVPVVSSQFPNLSKIILNYFTSYPQIEKLWNNAIKNSIDSFILIIPSLIYVIFDVVVVLFLSFYLIVDKEKINAEFFKLTPIGWHKNLKFVQKVIDETFSSFLRIQVIFGILSGITTWLVLAIFSIDFAASVALLAGLLTVIPLVGPILALVPPVFVAFLLFPESPSIIISILVILLIIQQLILNWVGPKLMGKAFKLHPIVVFLSIILGFKIAGAFGAIFVVPILAILAIVFKELGHYFINPSNN